MHHSTGARFRQVQSLDPESCGKVKLGCVATRMDEPACYRKSDPVVMKVFSLAKQGDQEDGNKWTVSSNQPNSWTLTSDIPARSMTVC